MKTAMELEVEKQVYYPGEEIRGRLLIHGDRDRPCKARQVLLTFHGEEILGAESLTHSWVTPFLKMQKFLHPSDRNFYPDRRAGTRGGEFDPMEIYGEFPFSFSLPEQSPPSFSSPNVQCRYLLLARIDIPWSRDLISRLHLTVLPFSPGSAPVEPAYKEFSEGDVRLNLALENRYVAREESLKGGFELSHSPSEPPEKMIFEVKAAVVGFEEREFPEVVWSEEKELSPDKKSVSPAIGSFEFFIPRVAPISGRWNSFQIEWRFVVRLVMPGDRVLEFALPFEVRRRSGELPGR
jgi:hypothetical protein